MADAPRREIVRLSPAKASQALLYGMDDRFDQRIDWAAVRDVESYDLVAEAAQLICAEVILCNALGVPRTVDLYGQLCRGTCEVSNVGADWMLTAKLEMSEAAIAHLLP